MTNTHITEEQVRHIAKLSNLPVTDEEVSKYAELFTSTLDYINMLEELDTLKVEGTYQVTGLKNVFMNGTENKRTLDVKEALSNAAEVVDELFATEAVFDR